MSAISRKNQITIPAHVLRAAGLAPGDDVRVSSVGPGHIELVKTDALIERYAGSVGEEVYPPGYLDDVRRGWR
jgi:AbrB family looped-hinge helix DNA binding protein